MSLSTLQSLGVPEELAHALESHCGMSYTIQNGPPVLTVFDLEILLTSVERAILETVGPLIETEAHDREQLEAELLNHLEIEREAIRSKISNVERDIKADVFSHMDSNLLQVHELLLERFNYWDTQFRNINAMVSAKL